MESQNRNGNVSYAGLQRPALLGLKSDRSSEEGLMSHLDKYVDSHKTSVTSPYGFKLALAAYSRLRQSQCSGMRECEYRWHIKPKHSSFSLSPHQLHYASYICGDSQNTKHTVGMQKNECCNLICFCALPECDPSSCIRHS